LRNEFLRVEAEKALEQITTPPKTD
jgi:hypothetical protein